MEKFHGPDGTNSIQHYYSIELYEIQLKWKLI